MYLGMAYSGPLGPSLGQQPDRKGAEQHEHIDWQTCDCHRLLIDPFLKFENGSMSKGGTPDWISAEALIGCMAQHQLTAGCLAPAHTLSS